MPGKGVYFILIRISLASPRPVVQRLDMDEPVIDKSVRLSVDGRFHARYRDAAWTGSSKFLNEASIAEGSGPA